MWNVIVDCEVVKVLAFMITLFPPQPRRRDSLISGLGRELAKAVLAAGHRLVATARKPEDLHDLVSRYRDRVRVVALDVTDQAAARAAVATATSAFGRLDVVVNNAGYANINTRGRNAISPTSDRHGVVHAHFIAAGLSRMYRSVTRPSWPWPA